MKGQLCLGPHIDTAYMDSILKIDGLYIYGPILNVAPASLSFHVSPVSYYLFLNAFKKDIFEPL